VTHHLQIEAAFPLSGVQSAFDAIRSFAVLQRQPGYAPVTAAVRAANQPSFLLVGQTMIDLSGHIIVYYLRKLGHLILR
jgi:hypothetical protein